MRKAEADEVLLVLEQWSPESEERCGPLQPRRPIRCQLPTAHVSVLPHYHEAETSLQVFTRLKMAVKSILGILHF